MSRPPSPSSAPVAAPRPAGPAAPPLVVLSLSRAALWMAGWLSLMVVLAIVGRGVTRQLPVFQVMEVRSLLGLLMIVPLVRAAGGVGALRTAFIGRHIARNVVHYAAQYGWF
ncbi:MAG: hypothetical protein RL375_2825, partial [Pseudomonadota bacterium]